MGSRTDPVVSGSPANCLKEVIESAVLNPLCYPNIYWTEVQCEPSSLLLTDRTWLDSLPQVIIIIITIIIITIIIITIIIITIIIITIIIITIIIITIIISSSSPYHLHHHTISITIPSRSPIIINYHHQLFLLPSSCLHFSIFFLYLCSLLY